MRRTLDSASRRSRVPASAAAWPPASKARVSATRSAGSMPLIAPSRKLSRSTGSSRPRYATTLSSNSLTTRTTVVPRNPISNDGGSCRLPGPTLAVEAVRESPVTTDTVTLGAPTVAPRSRPLTAVEAMIFGKVERVEKSKTPYDWGPEALKRVTG